MHYSSIISTRFRWFARKAVGGFLVARALNALSYFFQSEGLGNLLTTPPDYTEAIGFPLVVWKQNKTYGAHVVSFIRYLINTVFALWMGILGGGTF